jgi:hypothetical protein
MMSASTERPANVPGESQQQATAERDAVWAETSRLRELCREVANSGAAYGPRYVEVQIDNDTWAALRRELKEPKAPQTDETAKAVVAAAKAEVRAQGYRSTDMARALEAHSGAYWYETEVPDTPDVCGFAVTTEMDDGPLIQRCVKPCLHEGDHRFG